MGGVAARRVPIGLLLAAESFQSSIEVQGHEEGVFLPYGEIIGRKAAWFIPSTREYPHRRRIRSCRPAFWVLPPAPCNCRPTKSSSWHVLIFPFCQRSVFWIHPISCLPFWISPTFFVAGLRIAARQRFRRPGAWRYRRTWNRELVRQCPHTPVGRGWTHRFRNMKQAFSVYCMRRYLTYSAVP